MSEYKLETWRPTETPFLTIVTRHLYTRKAQLKRNKRSVRSQMEAKQLIEHLIIVDRKRRGYKWADKNLSNIASHINGRYVYILDDDDYLIDPKFVKTIKRIARKRNNPGVIIFKARWKPFHGRALPSSRYWKRKVVCGDIGSPCFAVRADLWKKYIRKFGRPAHGDFHFINKVVKSGCSVYWLTRIVAEVGQIGHQADGR